MALTPGVPGTAQVTLRPRSRAKDRKDGRHATSDNFTIHRARFIAVHCQDLDSPCRGISHRHRSRPCEIAVKKATLDPIRSRMMIPAHRAAFQDPSFCADFLSFPILLCVRDGRVAKTDVVMA